MESAIIEAKARLLDAMLARNSYYTYMFRANIQAIVRKRLGVDYYAKTLRYKLEETPGWRGRISRTWARIVWVTFIIKNGRTHS